MKLLLSLLVVVAGLAGRAAIDKALALMGGPLLVAAWAQTANIAAAVTTVSMAGFGVSVVARVAANPPSLQAEWLHAALTLSLALSGIVAVVGVPVVLLYGNWLIPNGDSTLAALALLAGWLSVASDLAALSLVGAGRPGRAAFITATGYLVQLTLLVWLPVGSPILRLLVGQVLFGAICLGLLCANRPRTFSVPNARRQLRAFAAAGLAIGLLSPGAALFARTTIANDLSWEAAGMIQAIWRCNEWTVAVAGGLLNFYFLPRLGRAQKTESLLRELGRAAMWVLLPASIITAFFAFLLPYLVTALYRPEFVPSRLDAIPFLLGDWMRIAAWVPLAGLYVLSATRAVTIGEVLSQPLFAVLIAGGSAALTLPHIGWAWACAYFAYAVFNTLALRERLSTANPLAPMDART